VFVSKQTTAIDFGTGLAGEGALRSGFSKAAMKALRWKRGLGALVLMTASQGGWAACLHWGPNADAQPYHPPEWVTRTFNLALPSAVLINPDSPVGTELHRYEIPVGNGAEPNMMFCRTSGTTHAVVNSANMREVYVPGWNNVYSTTIKGIGLKLSFINELSDGQVGIREWPEVRVYTVNPPVIAGYRIPLGARSRFRVQLIKTEPQTGSGRFTTEPYAELQDQVGYVVLRASVTGTGIVVQTPTCFVDPGSKNVVVPFGRVPQNSFQGPKTTTAERDFSIKLNCRQGAGMSNMVYLRMDGISDPAGDPGVLRLTPNGTGTATGVGIQVLDAQRAPVRFGQDMQVGPSKEGSYIVPFKARYFQTGDKVTGGAANGTATFTVEYK